MRRIIVWIVILSVLYFLLGYTAVLVGWLSKTVYLNWSGIIGALASVCGLLSFAISRSISNDDFQNIEAGYLKKIAQTADKLKEKSDELHDKAVLLNNAEEELKKMEIKKQEMGFLVRKASLSLFIQDQFRRNQERILEIVENSKELKRLLEESKSLRERGSKLDIKIKEDPNAELLDEIITALRREKEPAQNFIPTISRFPEMILKMLIR